MYAFEFTRMVNTAVERLQKSKDSKRDFPKITREVVRGTGITQKPDAARILKELREELTKRSAQARTSRAIAKRESHDLHKKIAP